MIEASLFQRMDFVGQIKMSGDFTNSSFGGYLSGLTTYSFHDERSFNLFDVEFVSSFDAAMNVNGRIDFDQAGFQGEVNLLMHANGELGANVSVLEYVKLIELSGELNGKAVFSNTTAHIEGILNVKVDVFGTERSVNIPLQNTIL